MAQNIRIEAIHPEKISENIATDMGAISAPPNIVRTTFLLIEAIPAPSKAISLICNQLLTMSVYPIGLSPNEINALKEFWGKNPTSSLTRIHKADNIGMQYPILFGINKFYSAFLKKPGPNLAYGCALFVSSCMLDSVYKNDFSNSIYYRHTYYLRDAILDACNFIAPPLSPIEFKIKVIEILSQNSQSSNKFLESYELLSGERIFATRIRDKANKKPLETNTYITSEDDPAPVGCSFSTTETFDPMDEHPTTTTISRTPSKHGSKLTKRDDRKVLRYRMQSIGARNIESITDLHRLTFPLVSKFLQYLFEKNLAAFSFGWILVSTGVDPEKLSDLCLEEVKNDNEYHLLPDQYRFHISIPFENGQTNFPDLAGKPITQEMGISIQFHLIAKFLEEKSFSPYQGMLATFDELAQKFSTNRSGITPTAKRMANSFYVVFADRTFGSLESSILSGTIPSKHRAQSCYYQHEIYQLNLKYMETTESFISRISFLSFIRKPLKKFLANLSFMRHPPKGKIGSQLYQNPDDYSALIKAIRSEFIALNKQRSVLHGESESLVLIRLIQLQHIYLYMLIQMAIALRPVGKRTEFTPAIGIHFAMSSTKSSSIYNERSQSYLPVQIKRQIKQAHCDFKALKSKQDFLKIRTTYIEDFSSSNLPCYFSFDPLTKRLKVIRMTGSKSRKLLSQFIHDHNLSLQLPSKANNVFRHINATLLYQQLPEILCDEYMSHHRDGLGMFDPWSSSSATCLPELEKATDNLVKHIPKAPLQIWSLQ